jgi:16S rRNA (uracil1498-N3)-methyltransferase
MLFLDEGEVGTLLPRSDERVRHAAKVLRLGKGDSLLAGMPDGFLGMARIESSDDAGMAFSFSPERTAPALRPVVLLLGFPRPIQAKRILKDLSSLGVCRIILSGTELGEKSYFQSDIFKNREFRASLIEGAVQAANPRLPRVDTAWTLARAMAAIGATGPRWGFDPYRAASAFGTVGLGPATLDEPLALAVGSERGWTPAELELLEAAGFSFASLGDRILKTETAAVTAVSIALSRLGYM